MNKKTLTAFNLAMINVIAVDSLRNLPTNAGVGLALPLFYLVATLIFLIPCVLITAELATRWPHTGGAYVWIREAFGTQLGFLSVWLQWIYNVFWYPTILSFIAANIAYLFDPSLANNKFFMLPVILAMFSLSTIVNWFGMRLSSLISTISAVVGTIIPMLFIIFLGILWIANGNPLAISPTTSHFVPSVKSINNIAFLVVIFFSLMGMEMSSVHAADVKNPRKDYPRALFYSTIIIVLTITLSSTAIALVIPPHSLNIVSGLDQALTLFLTVFHLQWLLPITVIIIILGAFGSMSAWVIGPTKGMMVAAVDGQAPVWLQNRNKHGAPKNVLIAQFVLVILLCNLFLFIKSFNTSYWILSALTAQMALIYYILLFCCALKLRNKPSLQKNYFQIPGGKIILWIVGLVGIFGSIGAILIGFIPPRDIVINTKTYEILLLTGLIIFLTLPFLLRRKNN